MRTKNMNRILKKKIILKSRVSKSYIKFEASRPIDDTFIDKYLLD